MNAERLLTQYARIADQPEGIRRFRRFILDLAVRGKLIPQDLTDEPAAELLNRVAKERVRLVRLGEIKADKPLAPVGGDTHFDVPATWRWTCLGAITSYIQRGKSPRYTVSDGSPVISQKCVQWAGLDLSVAKQVTLESLSDYEPVRFLRNGDLLWNSTGTGTIGRVIRIVNPQDRLVCDSHVTVVRCLGVDPEYIRTWLRSDSVYALIEDRASGSTNQVELTAQMAIGQSVPLPPLAEQVRIVAKVDELMVLCDRLEAARAKREAGRDRLTAASLIRLSAPDPTSLRDDARFALEVLPALTTRPDQISQIRQTILNLAMGGKLVLQDANDEPASKLLKRIATQRAVLLKSGYPNAIEARTQLKKQDKQALPTSLAPLPTGWEWATLQQCALIVIDCKNKTAPYAPSGIRLLRTTNVRDGKLNWIDQKFVAEQTYELWSQRSKPEPGDILITREAPMGEVAIIPEGEQVCLGQRMMLARLVRETVDVRFMLYSLRDPNLMDRVQDKPIGMTVQHLRVGGVETLLVPLPPVEEQRRIVAKVNELMGLCDGLEVSLVTTDDNRRRLLDALLAEALVPGEAREMEAVA